MPHPPKPYEHARFRAGLNVLIDPGILERYPCSPLAGRVVRTCIGYVHEELCGEDQEAAVPVFWYNQIFYVEEEYLCTD